MYGEQQIANAINIIIKIKNNICLELLKQIRHAGNFATNSVSH